MVSSMLTEQAASTSEPDGIVLPYDTLADINSAVYVELRRIAAWHLHRNRDNLTLGATDLVHEAVLRMLRQHKTQWDDPQHLIAIASLMFRRVLASHIRARHAHKRGGRSKPCQLIFDPVDGDRTQQIDLLALDEALTRLSSHNKRQSQIVELRIFGGLSTVGIADFMDLSPRSVQLLWNHARLWLARELCDA